MSKKLHISDEFSLPLELVTSTQAILARKRSGKSYTASVQAEELLDAGQQIAVIDPTGAWWGIKSSADGTAPGYQVVVFGGDHADAPLDFRAGKAMAAAIVEHGFSAIFDIGNLETTEQWQFVADFSSELLRINREAIHLFIDEADTFAPQQTKNTKQFTCLGTVVRLVSQGGIRGVGVTMITQRSAKINWDVLSQVDILTILRMGAPHDIKPVVDWLQSETSKEFAAEVKAALPSLPVGTAFIASASLNIAQRVEIRRRRTFNSGATPKPGERRAEPKVLASIDIAKLGQQIAESVQKAKDASPEALQAKVVELERALAAASVANKPVPVQAVQQGMTEAEREEVRMLKAKLDELAAEIAGFEALQRATEDRLAKARPLVKQLVELLLADEDDATRGLIERLTTLESQARPIATKLQPKAAIQTVQVPSPRSAMVVTQPRPVSDAKLDGPQERILAALAEFRAIGVVTPKRMHVCLFSGYSNMASKGFANAVSSLRTSGLIEYPNGDTVTLTQAGIAAAPETGTAFTDGDLQSKIEAMLDGPQTKIFRLAVKAYPRALEKDRVMAEAGYSNSASKGFANSVSRLRSLGFIDYPSRGEIVATAQCFLPGKDGRG